MAAEDKIDSVIDEGAIKAEFDYLKKEINDAIAAIQAAKKQSIAFNVDTKSMGDYNKNVKALDGALKQVKKATDDLVKANAAQARSSNEASKANLNEAKAATEGSKAKLNQAKAIKEANAARLLEQKIIQNALKEQKKLESQIIKEQKAVDDLENEYTILSKAYDDAAAKAKRLAAAFGINHPAAQQAIEDAQKLDKALKDIDAAVGQHRRNIGNYASATFSLTQVLREAPAFANSFATGISAIGNNLPILIDEFKKVKDQVGSTGQAFKIFASSMFTLTGLLPIALLAVQLFAKEITGFFASLTAGGRAMLEFNKLLENFQYETKRAAQEIENLRKEMEFLKEISNINLDIFFTSNFQKALTSLRGDSIDLTNLIGTINDKIAEADKRRRDIQESVISQLTDIGREVSAAYGTFADIPAAALDRLSEKEKKRFEAAKAASEEVTKLQLDQADLINARRILYRKIELEKVEEERRKNKELSESILDQLRREREAAFELWKFKQQLLIEEQKARAAVFEGTAQKQAREKEYQLEKELVDRSAEYELKSADNLAVDLAYVRKRGLISEEEYQSELLKIEKLTRSEIALIRAKQGEDNRNLLFEELNAIRLYAQIRIQELNALADEESNILADRVKAEKEAQEDLRITNIRNTFGDLERQKRYNEEETANRLKALAEQYKAGLINAKFYQDAKFAIEANGREKSIKEDIAFYEKLILIAKLPVDLQEKAILELHRLKMELNQEDINSTEKTEAEKASRREKYIKAAKEALQVFTGFFTDDLDRQKNAVQDQINLLEAQKAKDIEAERTKVQTAAERADAIAVIEARAASQKQQLDLRQRQLDQQKARWERVNTIAQIIQNTSKAITEALPNIPLSILVGAIGAAQLIRALSAPIPKYAEGTENHPGGLAWVGDGGRAEGVQMPDGSFYKTPAVPTLVDLPAGAKVYPDFNSAATVPTINFKQDVETIKQVGKDIVKAVERIPQPIIRGEKIWTQAHKKGSTFTEYLNKRIN